jgi:hypothetical protein
MLPSDLFRRLRLIPAYNRQLPVMNRLRISSFWLRLH